MEGPRPDLDVGCRWCCREGDGGREGCMDTGEWGEEGTETK